MAEQQLSHESDHNTSRVSTEKPFRRTANTFVRADYNHADMLRQKTQPGVQITVTYSKIKCGLDRRQLSLMTTTG